MAVEAVVRAFDILNTVAAHPQGIGITEISRQTNLHKSTVARLVATLEGINVVERAPNSTKVQLCGTFTENLVHVTHPQTLITLARPYLVALSRALGEDAGLVIPDGDLAFYVDQVSVDQAVQVQDWTGSRFPLHTVSAGKLFLAHRPVKEQESYLAQPLAAYTKNTMTDPNQLRASLAEIRQSGVSWIFDEFAGGLSAVAAPILNDNGVIIGALSIYGPSYRFPDPDKQATITALIKEKSAQLTKYLQEI
ncbi:MAG: IclR family transcriptional regulator [Chloroflexota bacterium]